MLVLKYILMNILFCELIIYLPFQVTLQWDEKEMVTALRDKKLISAILEDKGLLS